MYVQFCKFLRKSQTKILKGSVEESKVAEAVKGKEKVQIEGLSVAKDIVMQETGSRKMFELKKRIEFVAKILTYTVPMEESVGSASGSQTILEADKEPLRIISKVLTNLEKDNKDDLNGEAKEDKPED